VAPIQIEEVPSLNAAAEKKSSGDGIAHVDAVGNMTIEDPSLASGRKILSLLEERIFMEYLYKSLR
jgi:hypothetical protein